MRATFRKEKLSMEPLKERERKILNYMKDEIKKKGYPPTVREICTALGIKSTSTTHKDIENLELKGYIKKDPAKPRALMIIDPDPVGDEGDSANKHYDNSKDERFDVVDVPVVGRIAAGTPILAVQNIEDTIPVPARFLSRGNNFMLTVKGESMVEAGILDGDYILVQQQDTANNDTIENNPEHVEKFMAATTKGYEYAIENPEDAAQIIHKYAPDYDIEMLTRSQKYLADKYSEGVERWGVMKDEVWDGYTEFMYESGLIKEMIPASDCYTNQFLK